MLMCSMMLISMLAGCKGKEGNEGADSEFKKKVEFTMTNYFSVWCASTVSDYKDSVYDYITKKFNIDPEVWNCTEGESEKTRMWINGGTMPDVMWWESFSLPEYRQYVAQGLLKALPDGWEEKYPNIKKLIHASGIEEMIKVDGKTYVIPHSVYGQYCPADGGFVNTLHCYFRKDWAEQVGLKDFGKDYTVTISEFKDYLQKVKDAGLTEQAFNTSIGNMMQFFNLGTGNYYVNDFYETDEGFDWIVDNKEYTDMIKMMQQWYNEGLIDADFYTDDSAATVGYNQFANGTNPAYYWCGNAVDTTMMLNSCKEGFAGDEALDKVGFVHILADDGTSYNVREYNYWGTTVFKPDIKDEVFERALALIDWIASDEGFTTYCMGVPGVDWQYDANGNYELLNKDAEFRRDIDVFAYFGYCQDDFAFSGRQEGLAPEVLDAVKTMIDIKGKGVVHEKSDNYSTYESDAMNNYSIDKAAKVAEIVVGNLDVDTEWAKFCEDNKNLWEPLLNELNNEFHSK